MKITVRQGEANSGAALQAQAPRKATTRSAERAESVIQEWQV